MTFLIVGVDRRSLTPWHRHVLAREVGEATRLAGIRAAADGVALVVAAVIGPGGAVLPTRPSGGLVAADAA
jgi:hypothetical protein